MNLKMTAPCHFGLEKSLSFELRRAGAEDIIITDGRLTFSGDARVLAKANLSSSIAERIGVVIAEFDAPDFDAIYETLKTLPIHEFLEHNAAFPVVKGQTIKSKLTSIPALQRTVKKALAEAMIKHYGSAPETGTEYALRFFLFHDKFTLFFDSSGNSLYKRGYKAVSGEAPIRETLAAGLCDIARVRANDTIVDPLCGSGTILIEAALKALNIAPGINRNFAAENWSFLSPTVWQDVREELKSNERRDAEFRAIGYDIDPSAAELTLSNARKAGVDKYISASTAAVKDFKYPDSKCKVITNPPYAERLLDDLQVRKLYREMGQSFFPLNGNEVYIITPMDEFERVFGHKADKNRKLYNGMIQCRLWSFTDRK